MGGSNHFWSLLSHFQGHQDPELRAEFLRELFGGIFTNFRESFCWRVMEETILVTDSHSGHRKAEKYRLRQDWRVYLASWTGGVVPMDAHLLRGF